MRQHHVMSAYGEVEAELYANLTSVTDDGAQLYTLAALPWVPNGEENEWLRVCLDVVARMYIPASVGNPAQR
jgi:hypothetical protein